MVGPPSLAEQLIEERIGAVQQKQRDSLKGVRESGVWKAGSECVRDYVLFRTRRRINWPFVTLFALLHVAFVYCVAFRLLSDALAQPKTLLYSIAFLILCGVSVTAGTHRLWSHRSYSANPVLRFFLLIFQTSNLQNSVIHWSRDHRIHHKFSDTAADPHNIKNGFFFSHIGWLLSSRSPECRAAIGDTDLSDLYNDTMLRLQHKYYKYLGVIFGIVLPSLLPYTLWNGSVGAAFRLAVICRLTILYHCTFSINSFTHTFGTKPFDRAILPGDSKFFSLLTHGEGFHNFHHTFPQDYRCGPSRSWPNVTLLFIDAMSALGLITNEIRVSDEVICRVAKKQGDGSFKVDLE